MQRSRAALLSFGLLTASCTSPDQQQPDPGVTEREVVRAAIETRPFRGARHVVSRARPLEAMPEVTWFTVRETFDHLDDDMKDEEFACVARGDWVTCDPDEALRVLVPALELVDRAAMQAGDWITLSTLCSRCRFDTPALSAIEPPSVRRGESGGVVIEYATLEVGSVREFFAHRDEVGADGSVVRSKSHKAIDHHPLSKDQIRRGLRRMRSAFDECAREAGALDGTRVTLEFSISKDGGVPRATALAPYTTIPLGRCLAGVLVDKGRFGNSRAGQESVKRTITLHPPVD